MLFLSHHFLHSLNSFQTFYETLGILLQMWIYSGSHVISVHPGYVFFFLVVILSYHTSGNKYQTIKAKSFLNIQSDHKPSFDLIN